jgi:2-methylisocitrate lyase-like PEP mutase family enzyme
MMSKAISAGARFRKALAEEKPLQIMGTINPTAR